jgi:hypothetical protein
VVAGLTVVLAVPLLIGLGVLHDPAWFPHGDLAQIEMRVRDVPTAHPPLVGLGGRIEGFGALGSHPGPLGFFALWPVYWLFGADGWALQVASATLSLLAAALSLVIAHRRGGWAFAVAVACMLAMLMRGYGAVVLLQPWNPQLPILWWIVFLLGAWAVLCDDLAMLPVAVFAGSLCLQTHVPYMPLGAGIGAMTIGGLALAGLRRRHDRASQRRLLRWVGISAGLGVVLWLPPLIDQIIHDPGNMSIIIENFRHPNAERVPFGDAVEMFFAHLNVRELLTTNRAITGSSIPGVLLLAVWGAAVALAVRRREPTLIRLHAVVGAAALFGLVAMSRIIGAPWNYLMLWAWGTTALLVLATAWTLLSLTKHPPDRTQSSSRLVPPLQWPLPTTAALGATGLLLTTLFAVDAASTEMPNHQLGDHVRQMTPPIVATLDDDPAGCGNDCRYLVTSNDPVTLGTGLIVALERQGLDVYAIPNTGFIVRPHRVIEPDDADARIHLAIGEIAISEANREPGARKLTHLGLTDQQLADYRALRRDITNRLETEGLHDLATQVAAQEIIQADPDMPDDVLLLINQANDFERRRAVFLMLPTNAASPATGQERGELKDCAGDRVEIWPDSAGHPRWRGCGHPGDRVVVHRRRPERCPGVGHPRTDHRAE